MAITEIVVTSVSPRGGAPTTPVTISGSGFGVIAGTIVVDPLGANVSVTPLTWTDSTITFNIPSVPGGLLNRFSDIYFYKNGNTDVANFPFWIPATLASSNGLDYQWPNFEENTAQENTDNPRVMQAADFNRMLDLARVIVSGGSPSGAAGGQLSGTYPNPNIANLGATPGQVLTYQGPLWGPANPSATPSGIAGGDLTGTYPNPSIAQKGAANGQVLAWAGSAWLPITITAPPKVQGPIVPTLNQTAFTLTLGTPVDQDRVIMRVNSMPYLAMEGFFTVSGTAVTWTNQFGLDPETDLVTFIYWV